MFERISNGFSMARSSWSVIMSDKKLLLFPIISGIMLVILMAAFLIPSFMLIDFEKVANGNGKMPIWFYIASAVMYFVTTFVIVFCNAALVSCALLRFNGETATLGDGFRAAMARLPQIFGWALVSATVGLLLNAIEQAHEKIGYYIKAILGTAWAIMTYFVVPILVVEKVGPFAAVSRSTSLIKKTWGEALAGKIGIGLFLFLLGLIIFVPLIIVAVVVGKAGPAAAIAMLVIIGLAFVLFLALSAALKMVFLTAIYQYAAHDRVPDGFERETMEHAFSR